MVTGSLETTAAAPMPCEALCRCRHLLTMGPAFPPLPSSAGTAHLLEPSPPSLPSSDVACLQRTCWSATRPLPWPAGCPWPRTAGRGRQGTMGGQGTSQTEQGTMGGQGTSQTEQSRLHLSPLREGSRESRVLPACPSSHPRLEHAVHLLPGACLSSHPPHHLSSPGARGTPPAAWPTPA